MDHQYVIVRTEDAPLGYDVRTVGYVYTLLDLHERELLAYHWHPVGRSLITTRHLHLSNQVPPLDLGRGADPVALADMHLPTGSVWLADLVRLLIAEFGIESRRPDWQTVLQQSPPVP